MADPRFFEVAGPFTADELALAANATLRGPVGKCVLRGVAPIDIAGPEDVTFLNNRSYLPKLADCRAGLCILSPADADRAPGHLPLLVSPAPYMAFARVSRRFHPPRPAVPGVHPRAIVEDGAKLGDGVEIGPGAVVMAGAEIGDGSIIQANAVIDRNTVIGRNCVIGAGAYVGFAILGDRVYIYTGARIGQDGFGFASDPAVGHVRIPQVGRVLIGNDVEVGANSTVDRGAGPDTVIGDGCMIDNLVTLGHNVRLGRGCVIVAQVGVAGSSVLGDFVVAGGQVGIAGHLRVGAGTQLAAKSGVITDVPAGAVWGGYPAVPVRDWHRQSVTLAKLIRRRDQEQE
ncbi:UDP-3-O-(3-hydroxymyristoyl)glucosamine N-acyltransferase [Tistrella mobilis]|uniref:UDP-3-O-(3-hydroxymyristoyl)glucosamine N-acyltransferase n=1 Tax=Tistrella mobilis TaxID=171437 RepID=UPI003556B149